MEQSLEKISVIEKHKQEYGVLPQKICCAPARFHLLGENSWFFRDKTLSMAVNLPVFVALSKRKDFSLHLNFVQAGKKCRVSISTLKLKKDDERWVSAIKSSIFGFISGGFEVPGLDVTIFSKVLPSAGFGITTAIKIAMSYAISSILERNFSDQQILQTIECGTKNFLHSENRLADNFCAIFSKEKSVILTDHAKKTYENIPFNFFGKKIILSDAGVPRVRVWNEDSLHQPENVLIIGELKEPKKRIYGGWQYSSDSSEVSEILSVLNEDTRKRLLCIMSEHRCVLDAVSALKNNSFGVFARAINLSHKNVSDLYNSSCPEIDWILKRLKELNQTPEDSRNQSACGRVTGKGFGRCVYTIMNEQDFPIFSEKMHEYSKIFGFKPVSFEVEAAGGVKIL